MDAKKFSLVVWTTSVGALVTITVWTTYNFMMGLVTTDRIGVVPGNFHSIEGNTLALNGSRPSKDFDRAAKLLVRTLADTFSTISTTAGSSGPDTHLSMDADGKWTLVSIFVGLVLSVIWTIIWETYLHKASRSRICDLERALDRSARAHRDGIRDFLAATAMPLTSDPGTLPTDRELVDNPQHRNLDNVPQLPPLNLPDLLAPPMAHLPYPRF